jgi:hypothetical protein
MLAKTLALSVLAALALACGEDGTVRLRVELPADGTLSPLGPDTEARLTLIAESSGEPAEVLTRDFDPQASSAEFGDLAIRDGVRISLQAETPGGRLLGFGRASEPISVQAGEEIEVPIRLRRPFAYVAGAASLTAMDTTLDPGDTYHSSMGGPPNPVAVATTPDGAEIVIVAGDRLSLLSTSDHLETSGSVDVNGDARDLAISPDSRWAVVTHGGGVSIVDLDGVRLGGGGPVFVPLQSPSAAAVSMTSAYVLLGAGIGDACPGGSSSVVPITLETQDAGAPVGLEALASDLAVDGRTGMLVVAEPCRGWVTSVQIYGDDAGSSVDLLALPSPTTVAAQNGRVWAMGRANAGSGAHLVIGSVRLDGTDGTVIDLPAAEERAKTDVLSDPGQSGEVRIDADTIHALDLAVLPDGERIAFLQRAYFFAAEIDGYVGFTPAILLPQIEITTYEYQLVDANTGAPIQRLRTYCTLTTTASDWGPLLLEDFECTENAGQDVAAVPYLPRHVAVLYGDR